MIDLSWGFNHFKVHITQCLCAKMADFKAKSIHYDTNSIIIYFHVNLIIFGTLPEMLTLCECVGSVHESLDLSGSLCSHSVTCFLCQNQHKHYKSYIYVWLLKLKITVNYNIAPISYEHVWQISNQRTCWFLFKYKYPVWC